MDGQVDPMQQPAVDPMAAPAPAEPVADDGMAAPVADAGMDDAAAPAVDAPADPSTGAM